MGTRAIDDLRGVGERRCLDRHSEARHSNTMDLALTSVDIISRIAHHSCMIAAAITASRLGNSMGCATQELCSRPNKKREGPAEWQCFTPRSL